MQRRLGTTIQVITYNFLSIRRLFANNILFKCYLKNNLKITVENPIEFVFICIARTANYGTGPLSAGFSRVLRRENILRQVGMEEALVPKCHKDAGVTGWL